jgi:hypothetical protein
MNPPMRQSVNTPILFGRKGKEFPFFLLVDYPHLPPIFPLLAISGLLTLEPAQSIGETEDKIAGEPVGPGVSNIIPRYGPVDIGILLKEVISRQTQETILLFKHCLLKGSIQEGNVLPHCGCQTIVDNILEIVPENYPTRDINSAIGSQRPGIVIRTLFLWQ